MDDATKAATGAELADASYRELVLNGLDRALEHAYFDSAPDTKLRRLTWELHCELVEMGVVRVWPAT